ncbi:MAG: hypothetical protein D8H98_05400 [Prevotella sp.]|nr:MAG: hypothetical protein D8H98_05400 [Prevotella sp.]
MHVLESSLEMEQCMNTAYLTSLYYHVVKETTILLFHGLLIVRKTSWGILSFIGMIVKTFVLDRTLFGMVLREMWEMELIIG